MIIQFLWTLTKKHYLADYRLIARLAVWQFMALLFERGGAGLHTRASITFLNQQEKNLLNTPVPVSLHPAADCHDV